MDFMATMKVKSEVFEEAFGSLDSTSTTKSAGTDAPTYSGDSTTGTSVNVSNNQDVAPFANASVVGNDTLLAATGNDPNSASVVASSDSVNAVPNPTAVLSSDTDSSPLLPTLEQH